MKNPHDQPEGHARSATLIPQRVAHHHRSSQQPIYDFAGTLTHYVRLRVATRAVPAATGAFYESALYRLLARINAYLLRWVRNKYRRLRGRKKAQKAWIGVTQRYPLFFAHWTWINTPPAVW